MRSGTSLRDWFRRLLALLRRDREDEDEDMEEVSRSLSGNSPTSRVGDQRREPTLTSEKARKDAGLAPALTDPPGGTTDGGPDGGPSGTGEEGSSPASQQTPDGEQATMGLTGRIVCIANQKGGVGKTTTAVSVAAALAQAGAEVLLVDLDPQANATTGLGLAVHESKPSTYGVLLDELEVARATVATNVERLRCVPASLDLAGAEIELVPAFSREQRLREALEPIRHHHDVIIVDCPPTLGLLTVNGLVAADQVVLPIQCEYYALEGVGQLVRSIELVRRNLNPSLEIAGVVLTMYDGRTRLAEQVAEEVRQHFGPTVFRTVIPRSVRLSEAPGFGQPITEFAPGSRAARAYARLADEVADRLEMELSPLSTVSPQSPSDGPTAGEEDQR